MHTPGEMDEARKKAGEVAVKKATEYRQILAVGELWPMSKNWNVRLKYLQGCVALEEARGYRLAYETQVHKAMDCREHYKAGGKMIALILQTEDGKTTRWATPKGERPEPTAFDGEEQGFDPPKEGEAA